MNGNKYCQLSCSDRLTSFILRIFYEDFLFQSSFSITVKLKGKQRDFPYTLCHKNTQPPTNSIPQTGAFVTINELTLIHYNYPKSTVYIMVHSWCSIFYGFSQMSYDRYLSHTKYFHCPKILYARSIDHFPTSPCQPPI